MSVSNFKTSRDEVVEIIDLIEPLLEDRDRGTLIIAFLIMSITLQNPDITSEQLHDAVLGTSQYICTLLSVEGAVN